MSELRSLIPLRARYADPNPEPPKGRPTIWGVWSPPKFDNHEWPVRPVRARPTITALVGTPLWCQQVREALHASQRHMAQLVGYSRSTQWCEWEKGGHGRPNADVCARVLDLLNGWGS